MAEKHKKGSETVESIFDIIATIRKRPGLYFPAPSLEQLRAFLDGYQLGVATLEYKFRGIRQFDNFLRWLAQRLKLSRKSLGWPEMMKTRFPDETEAFRNFFDYFDEYCVKERIVPKPLGGKTRTHLGSRP